MQNTAQFALQSCDLQRLRSHSVNVRSPCRSYSPRPHTLCCARLQRPAGQQVSLVHRTVLGKPIVCRASQPQPSIDDADLVGEDAAFFDVEKQTTKSWTLFTGLLLGVLGLIYVVRPAVQPEMDYAIAHPRYIKICQSDQYTALFECRHGLILTLELLTIFWTL